MENRYDKCGLQPEIDQDVKKMIENFDRYYKPGDQRRDLKPWGIFLSKKYLRKLLKDMDKKDQNCIQLRLGIVEPPHDGTVHISWLLRPIHAKEGGKGELPVISNESYWNTSDHFSVEPSEPVVMKDPADF